MADFPPPTTTTTTHTLESKEMKNSTLESKKLVQKSINPYHKNVNKSKNRLALAKLESKKQDKKVLALWEGSGGRVPLIV